MQQSAAAKADCLECKLVGTMTCWGVSGYSFVQRAMIPPRNVFNRRWMAGFGMFWALAGAARAII
jgi:hypothetical protein